MYAVAAHAFNPQRGQRVAFSKMVCLKQRRAFDDANSDAASEIFLLVIDSACGKSSKW